MTLLHGVWKSQKKCHSTLRAHFGWTKVNQKYQKLSILASFLKPGACGQIVLPDRSVLKGQKLVENAKIQKLM